MSPEDLQSLNESLHAIARRDAGMQAPARVEAALLAAFREQSKPRVVAIRRMRPALLWLATAAAVVVVIFAATRAPKPRQESAAVVLPPAPVQTQEIAPPAPLVVKTAAPQRKVTRARPAQPELREREVVTEFMPVTPGELLAPEESGRVLRVNLPRSALSTFGLPMNVDRFGERIPADILLGEDGSTRAVRFVQTVSYR